jgi:hypothetical protein
MTVNPPGRPPWWLWLSVPIALLGIPASLTGILVDRIYERETASWETQAIGQDIANLAVLSALLVLGYAAARGSTRALLAWIGLVAATAYTYAIYAFAVHFGPLFLLYVAVLGMSVWSVIGSLSGIDPARVRAAVREPRAVGFVSILLFVVAGAFAVMWLSQDLPAMLDGTPSRELRDTGLLTNPVHVLDLALLLPAAAAAGVLLRRGRGWGHVLAPVMLSALTAISVGIVALSIVDASRGHESSLVVAGVIGAVGLVQAAACWRFLRAVPPGTALRSVLRGDVVLAGPARDSGDRRIAAPR